MYKTEEFSGVLPTTAWRKTALAGLLLAFLICTGCGDVFRPVANPLPGPTPDPKNFHFAIVASQNAPGNPGSGMQIDVSGDSNVGVVNAGATGINVPGQGPVHAALLSPSAGRVYIANGSDDSVSAFAPASTLGSIGTVTTISLPTGSDPVFVHSTESANMYVANKCPVPGTAPACTGPNISVISTATNAVTNVVALPAGAVPSVLAETPNGQKLYSVNQNSVTAINTVDKTQGLTTSFAAPVWAVASLDSTQVFVLDQSNGVITAINTFTDQPVSTSQPAGAGANFLLLDRHLNRLYVTNPTSGRLTIYDASVANAGVSPAVPPALVASVPMPATAPNPIMVTALGDGTQAYVISNQATPTALNWQVTAMRTSDNSIVNSGQPIATGSVNLTNVNPGALTSCQSARFRTSIASSLDSSRVYAAVCDAGATYIIQTSNNSCIDPFFGSCMNLPAPVSAYTPIPSVISVTGVAFSGANATYNYTLTSGPPLSAGMSITISGMSNAGNNGSFAISGVGTGTFTVANATAVAASGQSGSGVVNQPPPQNPVWVTAGP
jgi:hypothetical protein